jgi:hypothetical protein
MSRIVRVIAALKSPYPRSALVTMMLKFTTRLSSSSGNLGPLCRQRLGDMNQSRARMSKIFALMLSGLRELPPSRTGKYAGIDPQLFTAPSIG